MVGDDERYKIEGAKLFTPNKIKKHGDMDKFLNSRELWSKGGRTLIFYGDVYFTNEAMDTIIDYPLSHYILHCRPFNSKLTGTPYGECFAISFYDHLNKEVEKQMLRAVRLFDEGIMNKLGGWEAYRMMLGDLLPEHMAGDHWLTGHNLNAINDWTDDFDIPRDYDRFIENRAEKGVKGD